MKRSKAQIREKLDRQRELYDLERELLEKDQVVEESLPSAYGSLGAITRDIGICLLLLNDSNTVAEWFEESSEYYLLKLKKAEELEEQLEGSVTAQRPIICRNALYTALLADNHCLSEAIEWTLDLDEEILEKYAEFAPLPWFAHAKSLALYLSEDLDAAAAFVDQIRDTGDLERLFDGRRACHRGLLTRDAETLTAGIEMLLEYHQQAHGANPHGASEFISLDATIYTMLAKRVDLTVSLEEIDDDLVEYLLHPAFG